MITTSKIMKMIMAVISIGVTPFLRGVEQPRPQVNPLLGSSIANSADHSNHSGSRFIEAAAYPLGGISP